MSRQVPKYYAEYLSLIKNKKIFVCKEIIKECLRINSLVENNKYIYEPNMVEAFISFCEQEMTKMDGSEIKLTLAFKVWAERLFGWYKLYEDTEIVLKNGIPIEQKVVKKKRLTTSQYLIVGRGAAKSMYSAFVQAYNLYVNPNACEQIIIAPTLAQTEPILYPIIVAMNRCVGPLGKFYSQERLVGRGSQKKRLAYLTRTSKGIENTITSSQIITKPMRVDAQQGARGSVVSVDEWLSVKIKEDIRTSIEQGCSKNDEYIILYTSSEGTERDGPGDSIKNELERILDGSEKADDVSIFWYKLDALEEVKDPKMWIKANPNLGITTSYESYAKDVKFAMRNPVARNEILAKRFGIPTNASVFFFNEAINISKEPLSIKDMECSMGCDFSMGDDHCAFTFVAQNKDQYIVKTLCFISRHSYDNKHLALRTKYDGFISEGSIIVLNGDHLRMGEVYEYLLDYLHTNRIYVETVGYDPYNSNEFIKIWESRNQDNRTLKIPQTATALTVAIQEVKTLLDEGKLIFDQELMAFSLRNTTVKINTDGGMVLAKDRRDKKIDSVSALIDSWIVNKYYDSMYYMEVK